MHYRTICVFLLVAFMASFVPAATAAAALPEATVIHVKNMHCESCAKKIRRRLFAVSGVVSVKTDVKANVAVIVPQRNVKKQPSPRALWTAVEKAGFQPLKLAGPFGTFTAKPRR